MSSHLCGSHAGVLQHVDWKHNKANSLKHQPPQGPRPGSQCLLPVHGHVLVVLYRTTVTLHGPPPRLLCLRPPLLNLLLSHGALRAQPSRAKMPILDGLRSRVTMRLLVTGLRTFSVATSGVRDIVRINNNCKDALLGRRIAAHADKRSRDAVTRCKGDVQADAKLILHEDGFVPLESVYVHIPIIILLNLTDAPSTATSPTTAPS